MEEKRTIENENSDNEKFDYIFKQFVNEKYYDLNKNVNACTAAIKDIQVSFELFRREIAVEFVPRDNLDSHSLNVETQISTLKQEIADLKNALQSSQQKTISTLERIWWHLGTMVVVLALLDYFLKFH